MDNSSISPNLTTVEQAANWHVLITENEVSDVDKTAFTQWLQNAEHAEAYQRIESIWQQFESADNIPARNALQSALQQPVTKASVLLTKGTALSLIAGVTALLFAYQSEQGAVLFADHNTNTGEQQRITLPDNSIVLLNTASAINIEYTANARYIYLLEGEIFLDVAKDKTRPFIVKSEHGTARALGTQYTVRQTERETAGENNNITEVTVIESTVEVCAANENPKDKTENPTTSSTCQQLSSGETSTINNNKVSTPKAVNSKFIRDWQQNKLIVDDQLLTDVLDELQRYHVGYIHFNRKALHQQRISGLLPLNDISTALSVIENTLPVKINTYTSLLTTVTYRP